ncbi:securin isoform X2 [Lampris incognitus]|nr:securin isoform X2 [Lampris incognitus]XP_056128850.1 securin isoform X2 [Lampris incognitus]
MSFAERKNASLGAALKTGPRFQSVSENVLKTPTTAKKINTSLQSGRKALGTVNKIASTPATNRQEKKQIASTPATNGPEKKQTQEIKRKCVSQNKVEEYPEIEKFIPYDPLEFQKHGVPADVVPLSQLALAGLSYVPNTCPQSKEEPDIMEPYPMPSPPIKIPGHSAELDAFLQTINELTVDFPPESE